MKEYHHILFWEGKEIVVSITKDVHQRDIEHRYLKGKFGPVGKCYLGFKTVEK